MSTCWSTASSTTKAMMPYCMKRLQFTNTVAELP
jgi:hypothetical protein